MTTHRLPYVIIAHGSWHTPDAYALLGTALEERGYEVDIPSLPTCRADGISKTLSDDCHFFRAKLTRLINRGREIIVVMHSYGGMVGAGSVAGLERKAAGDEGGVIGLVFMTAFIPGIVGGLADCVGGNLPPWIHFKNDEQSGIRLCFIPEDLGTTIFYEPHPAAASFAKRMHPQPASTQSDPLSNGPGYVNWKIPMVYLICNQDQALLPQYQEGMIQNAEKNLNIKVERRHINGNHFPFLMIPEECADVIDYLRSL